LKETVKSGALGCVDAKNTNLQIKINNFLATILEKRKYYEKNLDEVKEILIDGEKRAKEVARTTMEEVHQKMKLG
jgi:tryptophanyl-tRNA synthetase